MTVRYRSTRADIWRSYAHLWRHSTQMKVVHVLTFFVVLFAVRPWLPQAGIEGPAQTLAAAAVALVAVLGFVAYPQIRFASGERTVTIGSAGVTGTLGARSVEVPWAQVTRVTPGDGAVYIVGADLNHFVVPDRAFADAAARDAFIALATRLRAKAVER
jgi:hypothetical protein